MMDILMKQFMPKDFDMEKATQAVADKANEITEIKTTVSLMAAQLEAIIRKVEPDTRVATAYMTIDYAGNKRLVFDAPQHEAGTDVYFLFL